MCPRETPRTCSVIMWMIVLIAINASPADAHGGGGGGHGHCGGSGISINPMPVTAARVSPAADNEDRFHTLATSRRGMDFLKTCHLPGCNGFSPAIWHSLERTAVRRGFECSAGPRRFRPSHTRRPDGLAFVTGGEDLMVRLWDLASKKVIVAFDGQTRQAIESLVSSNRLIMASVAHRDRWLYELIIRCAWVGWHTFRPIAPQFTNRAAPAKSFKNPRRISLLVHLLPQRSSRVAIEAETDARFCISITGGGLEHPRRPWVGHDTNETRDPAKEPAILKGWASLVGRRM